MRRRVFSLTDTPSSSFLFPCKCNQMPFYMWTYLYWPNVFFFSYFNPFFLSLLGLSLLSFLFLFFLLNFIFSFLFLSAFFFFLVVVVTHAILRLLH